MKITVLKDKAWYIWGMATILLLVMTMKVSSIGSQETPATLTQAREVVALKPLPIKEVSDRGLIVIR